MSKGSYLVQLVIKGLPWQLPAFGIAAVAMYLSSIVPLKLRDAINYVEVSNMAGLKSVIYSILILACSIFVLYIISKFIYNYNARSVELKLRTHYFDRVIGYGTSIKSPGDVVSRILNDVSNIRQTIAYGIPECLNAITFTLFSIYMMSTLHVTLTIVAASSVVITAINIIAFYPSIFKMNRSLMDQSSVLHSHAYESLDDFRSVKTGLMTGDIEDKFEGESDEYRSRLLKSVRIGAKFQLYNGVISALSLALILAIAAPDFFRDTLDIGTVVAFMGYHMMLANEIVHMGHIILLLLTTRVSLYRLSELFVEPGEEDDGHSLDGRTIQLPSKGEITIKNLTVKGRDSFRLNISDVVLPAGKKVLVTGRTGSGKSLLLKAFLREVGIDPGMIYMDSIDITAIPRKKLREYVTIALQDSTLFSQSVKYNVSMSRPESPMEEIEGSCTTAEIHEEISGFPLKYEQLIGGKGIKLSGGQRQRLNLARSILKKTTLLLFDEPFANVDSGTEGLIMKNILQELREKTVIIASNRLSIAWYVDEIWVLDGGKLVQRGTHEELITQKGLYKELVESFFTLDLLSK